MKFSIEGNFFAEMLSGSEEGSYLRLIDLCITQLYAREQLKKEKMSVAVCEHDEARIDSGTAARPSAEPSPHRMYLSISLSHIMCSINGF